MDTRQAKTAAGIAEKPRPPLEGSPALDLIRRQHAEIRDLFDEVDQTSGSERREAFERLVRLLAVHETAEEEVVHPLARTATSGGAGAVAPRLAEEREAKELLADLERRGPDGPDFDADLDRLRLAVLRHARSEERYELPKIQREAPAAALASAAPALRAAAAMAPTHPHPGTEGATANVVAGPFLAIADRVRDAVRKHRK